LTISASSSFSHDFWTNVVHHGSERGPYEEVKVARITAFVVGIVAIVLAIALGPGANVAFLVGLAFSVAASANLPAIVLSIFWKRFNTAGAVAALGAGLASSIGLIIIGPGVRGAAAIFPLENPGILSIPIGFAAAVIATLVSGDRSSEVKFAELQVRGNTGLGAEKPTPH